MRKGGALLKKSVFLNFPVLFLLFALSFLYRSPQPIVYQDNVTEAMVHIEAGIDIPTSVRFPEYMNRFDLRLVGEEYYKDILPAGCLRGNAVLITDSVTGHQWIGDGYSPLYNVL